MPGGNRLYRRLAFDNFPATSRTVVLDDGTQAGQLRYSESAPVWWAACSGYRMPVAAAAASPARSPSPVSAAPY